MQFCLTERCSDFFSSFQSSPSVDAYPFDMISSMPEYLGGWLCPSGDPAANLTRDVLQYLPVDIQPLFKSNATCAAIEKYVEVNCDMSDERCPWSQLVAAFCGCPMPYNSNETCVFCPDDPLPNPDYVIQSLRYFGYPPTSCQDLSLLTTQLHIDSAMCDRFSGLASYCGCSTKLRVEFFATNDKARKELLIWMSRISSLLSLMGSAYIIRDVVLTQRQARGNISVYFELMLCMSLLDICGSIAWMFITLPVPTINAYGERTTVYGAKGTDATYTLQGFFIQIGFTGIFYNLVLSVYYLLTIRYGWREDKLRGALPYFCFTGILGIGLGTLYAHSLIYNHASSCTNIILQPLLVFPFMTTCNGDATFHHHRLPNQ
jgi:hypothetical protein